MELFGTFMVMVMDLFRQEFTLWGFTFSFWQVFVFTTVAGIIGRILWEVFLGE